MFSEERYQTIMDRIKKNKSATVNELSQLLEVSVDTIRRDLKYLEKESLVIRTHGGAILPDTIKSISVKERKKLFSTTKINIGKAIIPYISDYDVIFLDGSSTTILMVPLLKSFKGLTIVTNSMYTALEVIDNQLEASLQILGGKIMSLTGSVVSIEDISKYRFTKVVISCCGFEISEGLFDLDLEEAAFKKQVIQNGQSILILLDHSKFEMKAPMFISNLEENFTVITDDSLPEHLIQDFKNNYTNNLLVTKKRS